MIREIVETAEKTYIINFPKELVGKKVEVIAFEIEEEPKQIETKKSTEQLQKEISAIKSKYDNLPPISHEYFKFNRDDANDYE